LPGPRVIEIYDKGYSLQVSRKVQTSLVALQKTCVESRNVAKFKYQAVKAWAYGIKSLPKDAIILVDHMEDIITLTGQSLQVFFTVHMPAATLASKSLQTCDACR
jgi:hypothetical protein